MDSMSGERDLNGGNESQIALPEIDGKLNQLRQFEADLQNDEVVKAKVALHKVFDPRLEWFTSRGIIITYHGSLQYNDPRNLDADIEFMRNILSFEDVKDEYLRAEKELIKPGIWPRECCSANLGTCSIDRIKKELKNFEGERYNPNPEEDRDFSPEDDASLILSSKVLYESQEPQFEELQREVRKLIAGNQWLREGVSHALGSVIKVRQDRRRAV